MAQGQATTNFTDAGSAGVDLGVKYVTKDYLMTFYPNLVNQMKAPALWTWGNSNNGQLGNGSTANTSSPGTVAGGGQTWFQIACGAYHMAAIKTDGTLWTWGYNPWGSLGNGATNNTSSPATTVGGGTTWSQVSCGYVHTAAIKTDGTLWTWGGNLYGTLGNSTTTNRSSPGTVAGGGTTWNQVACGYSHVGAIKTDGTLWTCGFNNQGQLGNGTKSATVGQSSFATVAGGGTTWSQVSGGFYFTAAVKTDGTLWTWGGDTYGQLGNGSTTSTLSPATVAGGGTTWKSVSCGSKHNVAIKTDGTLWTCGYGAYGQLGNGITTNTSSFATVAGGGTTWKQIAGGFTWTAAIKTDGTLWTWGNNGSGGLGNGSTLASTVSPGTVSGGGTTWKSVACPGYVVPFIAAIAEAQGY